MAKPSRPLSGPILTFWPRVTVQTRCIQTRERLRIRTLPKQNPPPDQPTTEYFAPANPAGLRTGVSLAAMTRPRPDLWYPIAQLLAALRTLLRATAPEAFAQIALDARAHLAALTALVRRYIHVLAADINLPLPQSRPPAERRASRAGVSRAYLFPLIETPARASGAATGGEDPPELQWALLMEAAARLAAVLANPAPHARRLARRFGKLTVPGLRDLPVPWHIIRRIGPVIDTLLIRLDAAARPQAWAGLDTS